MAHIMLDIETIDTLPTSVVLSFGAVKFDPYSLADPYDGMYHRLQLDEQSTHGRTISDDTVEWWSKQHPDAQKEVFDESIERTDIPTFLAALNKYMVGVDKIWSQGPVFDICILENMYRMYSISPNWRYSQVRDSRTLFDLGDDSTKRNNMLAHNALADSYTQALSVQAIYKQLGMKKK